MIRPAKNHDFSVTHPVNTRMGVTVNVKFCSRCGRGELPYVKAAPCHPATPEEIKVRVERKLKLLAGLA